MDETLKELKKLGNKVYSLSQKIQECDKKGMSTRCAAYYEDLVKCQDQLAVKLQELKQQIKF